MSDQSTISLNWDSLKVWQQQKLESIRYDYDLKPDDVVIDLGAYMGDWAAEIYERYKCKIICVEPTSHIQGIKFAEVINKAVGTHNGKMKFGGAFYYTSSFEKGNEEYECFDIAELILNHPEIALLKINIEGGEYDVLDRIINLGLHKRIKNIQVQFHQIEGVPYELWYDELSKKLSLTHSVKWKYLFCWESWLRIPEFPGDRSTKNMDNA